MGVSFSGLNLASAVEAMITSFTFWKIASVLQPYVNTMFFFVSSLKRV